MGCSVMKCKYEMTVILDPDLNQEQVNVGIEKLSNVIKTHGGEIESRQDAGKRSLQYPLSKKTFGNYVVMVFTGDNKVVADLERQILIDENFFRHLIVKKDKFAPADSIEKIEEVSQGFTKGRDGRDRQSFSDEFSDDIELEELAE